MRKKFKFILFKLVNCFVNKMLNDEVVKRDIKIYQNLFHI